MKKLFFVLLLFSFIGCRAKNNEEMHPIDNDSASSGNFIGFLSSLKLPDSLDFCGERVPLEIPEVKERAEREFYLNLQQPGQLILLIKRSGRYFPMFEKELNDNNMPDDLKYISVAESALYMARSPKDAVGLWQFIPATGKKMGLIIDDFVDERRSPEKSSKAAILYLMEGYNNNKSWTLAAAGYNMGHENVADNIKFQTSGNFYDLYLNEETSRYILRIVIIKELMRNHEKYGIKLSDDMIYKPDNVKTIKCDKAIPNLADWAKESGVNYKMVKLLNPWILQRKLPAPPKGIYWEILVPN